MLSCHNAPWYGLQAQEPLLTFISKVLQSGSERRGNLSDCFPHRFRSLTQVDDPMTDLMEKALATVRRWPDERQNEAAELLLALDRLGAGPYRASDAELKAVDEALAGAERGEFASEAEVEAAFSRFRR